ncbi:MAG TPA: hypothetical protein VIY49_14340 [Bryobacteraceae bacterium]
MKTTEFEIGRISISGARSNRRMRPWLIPGTIALLAAGNAFAETTITGTVGASGKYLVTGAPVTTTTAAVLKISFGNDTPGTNLALCAGTAADFASGTCGLRLSDSGGPGFTFLTIVDTPAITGKILYVIREVGVANSTFTLTIE